MEIHFPPDVQSKLTRLADQQGLEAETLVQQAVERMVNYDEWFGTEVQAGLSQIKQGRTLSHEQVGARLAAHLANKHQTI